jgi:DNA-binding XRE family transcriptional regulator
MQNKKYKRYKNMDKKDEALIVRLKTIRHTLDLSQKEFAKQIKISAPSYSEIESGKYKPKFDVIRNIGRAFNVNLYYLIYGEGEMFIDPSHPFFKSTSGFLIKDEEVRRFFRYFEYSPLVQFMILAEFRKLLNNEKAAIEKEMAEALKDNKE